MSVGSAGSGCCVANLGDIGHDADPFGGQAVHVRPARSDRSRGRFDPRGGDLTLRGESHRCHSGTCLVTSHLRDVADPDARGPEDWLLGPLIERREINNLNPTSAQADDAERF